MKNLILIPIIAGALLSSCASYTPEMLKQDASFATTGFFAFVVPKVPNINGAKVAAAIQRIGTDASPFVGQGLPTPDQLKADLLLRLPHDQNTEFAAGGLTSIYSRFYPMLARLKLNDNTAKARDYVTAFLGGAVSGSASYVGSAP